MNRLLVVLLALTSVGCRSADPSLEKQLAVLEEEIRVLHETEARSDQVERDLDALDAQLRGVEDALVVDEVEARARLERALAAAGFGSVVVEVGRRGESDGQEAFLMPVRATLPSGALPEILASLAEQPLLTVVEEIRLERQAEFREAVSLLVAVGIRPQID